MIGLICLFMNFPCTKNRSGLLHKISCEDTKKWWDFDELIERIEFVSMISVPAVKTSSGISLHKRRAAQKQSNPHPFRITSFRDLGSSCDPINPGAYGGLRITKTVRLKTILRNLLIRFRFGKLKRITNDFNEYLF